MTSGQYLSRIRKVHLREVWPYEDRDFTRWLADNIAELRMTLGIALEVEDTEVQVGKRKIDILATDTCSGRPVIIENQLENSDGDHLSRMLIYAAGKDADTIIWIAKEFEEEHRLTLRWLNQLTDRQTKFFGIAVEVWRIGSSPPAPHFRMVVAPDDWQRAFPRRASPNERREFWQTLEHKLEQNNLTTNILRDEDDHRWLSVDYADGVRYAFDHTVEPENGFYLALQLDTLEPDGRILKWCREAFDLLEKDKECIETRVGSVLEWDRKWYEPRGSRIISHYPFYFYDLMESSDDLHDWAVEKYRLFREVFEPKREELNKLDSSDD